MPTEIQSPKDATASFMSSMNAELPKPTPAEGAPPVAEVKKADAPTPEPKIAATATPAAPVEDKIPRTSQEWKKFTAKRDADIAERDARIATAEKKASELEAKSKTVIPSPELDTLKADLEKARKERDEYDERLKMVAVTQHPVFQKTFDDLIGAQIAKAKTIVEGGDQQEAIERIIAMPEGKYKDARAEEFLAELSERQKSKLDYILNSVAEINAKRQDTINNSKEEYDKMTAAQKSQADSRTAQMEAALKDSLAKAPEHPLYKKSEDAEWNKDVDARLQRAEQLARSSLSVGDSTKIVLDHLALPVVWKQLESSKAEVENLKAQIQDFTQANPGLVSRSKEGSIDDGTGIPVRINPGSNPMEAARAWMKSLPKFG